MRKILLLSLAALMMTAVPAFADEIDDALPAGTPQMVEDNVRKMVDDGIQKEAALEMANEMAKNKFDDKQMLEAQKKVMEAHQKGLPVEPLMDNIKEGEVKHMAPDDVVHEMEVEVEHLEIAHAEVEGLELEPGRGKKLTATIAEGMAAGLEPEDVHQMQSRVRERTRTRDRNGAADLADATFEAARDLARQGVSSKKAAHVVEAALEKEYEPEDMHQMRTRHQERTRTRNRGADDAADDLSREIEARGKAAEGEPAEVRGKAAEGEPAEARGKAAEGEPAKTGSGKKVVTSGDGGGGGESEGGDDSGGSGKSGGDSGGGGSSGGGGGGKD